MAKKAKKSHKKASKGKKVSKKTHPIKKVHKKTVKKPVVEQSLAQEEPSVEGSEETM